MQPRQILIVAGVAIVAFAAAFGIAGAGGGEESKAAGAGLEPAEVIQVGDASVSTGGTAVAGLPALQVPKKKKPKPDTSSSGGTTTTTTTTTTAPTTTAPTTTAPTTTAPTITSPPPANDGGGSGGGPISEGGGED